jgi:glycosyltransferase involved in cell wall biosynthesis
MSVPGSVREGVTAVEQEELPEVSVVMHCLNKADTLGVCIERARSVPSEAGIRGEISIPDNGSADGSPEIAARKGAGVCPWRRAVMEALSLLSYLQPKVALPRSGLAPYRARSRGLWTRGARGENRWSDPRRVYDSVWESLNHHWVPVHHLRCGHESVCDHGGDSFRRPVV